MNFNYSYCLKIPFGEIVDDGDSTPLFQSHISSIGMEERRGKTRIIGKTDAP